MARQTVQVFETTGEEIKAILPENKELMDDFLNYMETTDHAKTSIRVYKNNLEIFFIYLMKHEKNLDFVNLKKRHIMNFQNYMVKNDLSPSRIKNIKSTLSSMSNFIESVLDEEEKWENFRNIINKIPAPNKRVVREKTVLSDEECQNLLDFLVENKRYQQACAFALGWASGRRKSELLRIKRSYITEENLQFGSLYKSPEKVKTKGKGRGKFIDVYVLKPKFKKYFDLWMEERERLGVPDEIDEIFVNKRKGEWQPAKISLLDSYASKFTEFLHKDFYFHCLRHQFTSSLEASKIPAMVIKDIIGWEDVSMVAVYSDNDLSSKLGDYFSEDGVRDDIQTGSLNNLDSESSNSFGGKKF
jgi:site-specific recombinase XerD